MKTPEKLYRIKPLNWQVLKTAYYETLWADVGFGAYRLQRSLTNKNGDWSSWELTYCFDEWHDEGDIKGVTGEADGKKKAEKDWLSRILPHLEAVK